MSQPLSTSEPEEISGRIGASGAATGGVFYDTLDEPVTESLMRDLKNIFKKLILVLSTKKQEDIMKDWDLWGPLLFCLALAIIFSLEKIDQSSIIFCVIFVIVWLGSGIVTINSKLLGGKVSFLQNVCLLGYCMFPLVIAAIISSAVNIFWVRLIVCILAFGWSCYASIGFLIDTFPPSRRGLALYPICLFYFIIGWMVLMMKVREIKSGEEEKTP